MRLFFYFSACDLLLVDGFQHLATTPYRRLHEALTLTQLQENFGLLEFLLVLLQRFVDVFAIL